MASLPEAQRRQLEKAVIEARDVAESGARAAIERLAVDRRQPFAEMTPAQRELRVRLRAHARQLGDPRKENGEQETRRLVTECAYEIWHRMLFARFLAENRLLIHPDHGVAVTLAECQELAAKVGEGDGWALAARLAARMLPAIFRPDDPVLAVRLAPEHQQSLERLLAALPAGIFVADDSLGWVYQFWQTKRKKEVNESGRKIGADELPAVTQLFTEPYMVKFLLHNTLGAWWAGKVLAGRVQLAQSAASEEELRRACALPGCEWTYLRFVRGGSTGPWRPAAGTFEGWPNHAADVKVLDPCCGSGHFLVEAFGILVSMRMAEEGLPVREVCDAVIRDNLFGLEMDERCTQIAAFNLAIAAWTHPGASGHRVLPDMNIACSGLSVGAKVEEWLSLAGKDERLQEGMRRLYRLFRDAPTLGSLTDPRREIESETGQLDVWLTRFNELRPLLETALAREDVKRDAVTMEAGIAAQGMAKAAALLAGSYTLVATNVPYLGYREMAPALVDHVRTYYPAEKGDLGYCLWRRLQRSVSTGGGMALVTLQHWLSLRSYTLMREQLFDNFGLALIAHLGTGAFETITGAKVNVTISVTERSLHAMKTEMCLVDSATETSLADKARVLRAGVISTTPQTRQFQNPDHRISFGELSDTAVLSKYSQCLAGIMNGDTPRFVRSFWEMCEKNDLWVLLQSTVPETREFGGLQNIVFFDEGSGHLREDAQIRRQRLHNADERGNSVWGRGGVGISQMAGLPVARYLGNKYDSNVATIVPRRHEDLAAIWTFCSSVQFAESVRAIDRKLNVTNATFGKVPFDLARWRKAAADKYPNGLPRPFSDDPTQWIFHGHPFGSVTWDEHKKRTVHGPPRVDETGLQVAVARLLGYRWPAELDPEMELADEQREWAQRCNELLELPDKDSIVCIPPVGGDQPAADRLQQILARAYGGAWGPAVLAQLLEEVGFGGKSLEEWLRDGFFEQHCQLFHQRPFVWHIWDGRRRDGFAAFVNCHRLDRRLLERLTYDILGDWIVYQRHGVMAGERGAEDRLAAADALQKKLALILEGEPPNDIFVRWKPLNEQPLGWEPDLNDGVRMNIRPFIEAGVLRKDPKIRWTKDRGQEPQSLRPKEQFPWFWKGGEFMGERVNDVHLTNAQKRAARELAVGQARRPRNELR